MRTRPKLELVAGIAGAAAALLLLVQSPALARPGHRGGHSGFGHLERALQKLDLDEERYEAAHGVLEAAREEGRELRSRLRAAHREMRDLLDRESPDPEAVLAQADVVGALRTQMRKHELRAVLDVQALLPPEDRAAFRERAQRRGPGHDRGHREKGCEDR